MKREGIEMLRALLDRDEPPKPEPFRPLRFYRRREPHRTYMRFEHGRPRCPS